MSGSATQTLERKFARAPLEVSSRDGVFEGYASLFGKRDLGNDVVVAGAFKRSIETRGAVGVRLLYQHEPTDPIGTIEALNEDGRGLHVRGRISSETGRGREVLSLMGSGAIDGLSIGYRTEQSMTDKVTGIRRLIEVDLWEISIVTFPMLPGARAHLVAGDLPTERKFERWLTRDAGFTRSQARRIVSDGYRSLNATQDAGETGTDHSALALKLKAAALELSAAAFRSSINTPKRRG